MTTRTWSPVRTAVSAALAVGFLISAAVIWQSSRAAFFGTTWNGGNQWSAGTVSLTDNDSNGALFNASGLKPTDTGSACIKVTYGGSLDANVKLYVKAGDLTGTGLGPYVNLKIEEGDGNVPFGNACTNFTNASTLYDGTIAAAVTGFTVAHTDFGSGVGSFAPTGGSSATKAYRFTWTLQDDNAAQGLNCTVKFTWEAQNT
jgi:hypothetical protein